MGELAVYVHTPFCPSKCPYCDFNSYARPEEEHETFTRACELEIRRSEMRGARVGTVFFGGGTPTFLSVERLERLFSALTSTFDITTEAEITAEANPGTVDAERFTALRAMGFNRISIGAQSFHDHELRTLGRVHSSSEISRAVCAARRAGFGNLSLDLMYALPGQTLGRWIESVKAALAFEPEHLSLYCLTIEPGTRFAALDRHGLLDLPDEDVQIAMQEEAERLCAAAGLRRYEISNYAKPGRECEHNLSYWRNEPYAGFGPGAVSYLDGERRKNLRSPARYAAAVLQARDHVEEREKVGEDLWLAETLMVGLRVIEGVPFERLESRVPDSRARLASALNDLKEKGWVEVDECSVRLTREGLKFHDSVTMRLLP
ncbi:MAG: radical SAM family heme chaperone HemW [Fimbriimonadia bacterium]